MCLAIYKPSKVVLSWDELEEGFVSNNHGAGFAYVENRRVHVEKGFFSFSEFRAAYEPHAEKQSLIHFRLATHGERDDKNCHPFYITNDLVMIHNGVLPIKCDTDKSMSDTWHYVHHILTPLAERDPDFYSRLDIQFLGEAAIGYSKFAFLRADGDYCIWNDELGHWHDKAWFSNSSYVKSTSSIIRGFGTSSARVIKPDEFDWDKGDLDNDRLCGSLPEYDADNSQIFDDLTDKDQQVYELLLSDGWDVGYLDDVITTQGVNGMYDLLKTTSYDGSSY